MFADFLAQMMPHLESLGVALIMWLIRMIERRRMNGKYNKELNSLKSEFKKRITK